MTKITGTLQEELRTLSLIPSSILLPEMRNVASRICKENQNTHFTILFSELLLFITWKNTVKADRLQMTIRRMRYACWLNKATDAYL